MALGKTDHAQRNLQKLWKNGHIILTKVNHYLDIIYLDFQKAFDIVPYERLLTKLNSYGIQGNLLGWIKNFLTNRTQSVVLNGVESNSTKITSGISQESVLEPILFNIYINDLSDIIRNKIKLFADDTKLYSVIKDQKDIDNLQQHLNNLEKWFDKWLLKFNPEKCKHMQAHAHW